MTLSLLRPHPPTISMYNEAEKQNFFSQSHRVHITLLIIHALGVGDTHTHTHTHTHSYVHLHRSDFKKPGAPGLKT